MRAHVIRVVEQQERVVQPMGQQNAALVIWVIIYLEKIVKRKFVYVNIMAIAVVLVRLGLVAQLIKQRNVVHAIVDMKCLKLKQLVI